MYKYNGQAALRVKTSMVCDMRLPGALLVYFHYYLTMSDDEDEDAQELGFSLIPVNGTYPNGHVFF